MKQVDLSPIWETEATYLTDYFHIPQAIDPSSYLYEVGLGQVDIVLALLRGNRLEAVKTLTGKAITQLPPDTRFNPQPLPSCTQSRSPNGLREGDQRRVVSVVRNPRLPTTDAFQRFKEFKIGRTVSELLVRGLSRRDIRLALRDGFIRLED